MATEPRSSNRSLMRLVLIGVGAFVFVQILMMAIMMPTMGWMMTDEAVSISPTWGIVMGAVYFLILLGFGYIIYRAVTKSSQQDAALKELRRTYARGELTQEEFEQREEDLKREK